MHHTNVPASYLIFEQENKILLIRRFQTGYCDGQYSLVAGHVESGETFTQAAIREAREEAGVEVNSEDLDVVYVLHRDSQQDVDSERVDVFVKVHHWEGVLTNMEPHKCDQFLWCAWDELPQEMIPYIRFALDNIREGKMYGEYGWRE